MSTIDWPWVSTIGSSAASCSQPSCWLAERTRQVWENSVKELRADVCEGVFGLTGIVRLRRYEPKRL